MLGNAATGRATSRGARESFGNAAAGCALRERARKALAVLCSALALGARHDVDDAFPCARQPCFV